MNVQIHEIKNKVVLTEVAKMSKIKLVCVFFVNFYKRSWANCYIASSSVVYDTLSHYLVYTIQGKEKKKIKIDLLRENSWTEFIAHLVI